MIELRASAMSRRDPEVPRRPRRAGLAVIAVVLVLAGLGIITRQLSDPAGEVTAGDVTPTVATGLPDLGDPAALALARAQLTALSVAADDRAAYDRDAYGERWADVESNGCNQRDDRLFSDALPGTATVAVQGTCDHDVLAGQWVDPYTGELLVATDLKDQAQAQATTIDHLVPLAEAHRSGAAGWTAERRLFFANDLPGLRVVAGNVNSGKSDQDPSTWLPDQAAICWYAVTWIAIKTTWALTVDPAEHAALQRILADCSGTGTEATE